MATTKTVAGARSRQSTKPRVSRRRRYPIFRLRISLREVSPEVFRIVEIPGETLLPRVHEILQTVMGWENYHLHDFRAEGATYGVPNPGDDFLPIIDEHDVSLYTLVARHRPHFAYFYDYGDGWEHDVVAEENPNANTKGLPRCVAGARACPPEDVGGPYGYETYLEALRDPNHPEHEEYFGWRGPFDAEQFELAKINRALHSRSKSRRQMHK